MGQDSKTLAGKLEAVRRGPGGGPEKPFPGAVLLECQITAVRSGVTPERYQAEVVSRSGELTGAVWEDVGTWPPGTALTLGDYAWLMFRRGFNDIPVLLVAGGGAGGGDQNFYLSVLPVVAQ